ncbi:MAG: response regulator [Candidatus Binatia bacterium]|nr:response regulator [Candidatus Binatia bacterium]
MMDRKPKVLGVDDSLTIRKALEIVLKPAGYDLELAVDGADAIAKAKSFKPDVILLDFILPDMRGSEVCQHLALDPETAHIPVILVSAKGAEIRQAYRDARNVVSYIAKPFKPQVVTGIVAEVLAKTAAGEQVKAAVPVHEAEGLSIPPVAPMQPPIATPPVAATPPPPIAPLHEPASELSASSPPAVARASQQSAAPTPPVRKVARREAPMLPFGEAPRAEFGTPFTSEANRREALDLMFETLRSSTEGVYVEEVDTPLGATADQAKSYIEILEALIRELGEGLQHARSGVKYRLYSDGSVRSFDESLHEIFRRSCRLLFRATSAGAVAHEAPAQKLRVLIVATKGSAVHRQISAVVSAHPEWQVFHVTEGFRQLPMIVRLFAPAVVLTEVTWSGALWEQLGLAARLPELAAARVFGIVSGERPIPPAFVDETKRQAVLQEHGIQNLVGSLFEAEEQLATPSQSVEPSYDAGTFDGQESPQVTDGSTPPRPTGTDEVASSPSATP